MTEDEAVERIAQTIADWHSGTPEGSIVETDRREARAVIAALRADLDLAAAVLGGEAGSVAEIRGDGVTETVDVIRIRRP